MAARAAVLSALAGVLCAGLLGCGDPNAGDAAAGEFDTWWPDHRVDGFEASAAGQNTLPFSGELSVTVRADPGVDADDVDQVRGVVCSFEPDASASVTLELVGQVVTVEAPCTGESDVESSAFLELDDFLAGLGAESAEADQVVTPRLAVVLPDDYPPARAREVGRLLTDFLRTQPGVFVDGTGSADPDEPVEVTVRVGGRIVRSEPQDPSGAGPS